MSLWNIAKEALIEYFRPVIWLWLRLRRPPSTRVSGK